MDKAEELKSTLTRQNIRTIPEYHRTLARAVEDAKSFVRATEGIAVLSDFSMNTCHTFSGKFGQKVFSLPEYLLDESTPFEEQLFNGILKDDMLERHVLELRFFKFIQSVPLAERGNYLMSGFHGGYSLGTLLGAGAMSVLFSLGLVPVWAVIICMIGILIAMIAGCRDLLSKDGLLAATPPVEKSSTSAKRFHIPPMVIVIGLLCFIMYASEGAVMGWSAIFVSEERGVDISAAGFFYTAFAVMMTAMRFLGDSIVSRLGQRRVVVYGALAVGAGFALVILVPSIIATAAGFTLVGLGAANIVPQFISFASGIQGMAMQNIISIINALGYSGILLGPVLIGFVAKHYGLHTSFAAIAVAALVVAVVSTAILKSKLR